MSRARHILDLAVFLLAATSCSRGDATAPLPAGTPTAMIVVDGNNQAALGGSPLARPVTFKLTDIRGTGVPNTTVDFAIAAGEGSLAAASTFAKTDQSGLVAAPVWTLGKLVIPQQLTASVGTISATATAVVRTQYQAELRFFGPSIDPAYLPAFTRALNRLNAEVIGELTPVTFTNEDIANTCGVTGVAPISEQIGSLVIFASVDTLGVGNGAVAMSGPCYVRQSNKLTVVGTMQFSATDLPTILSTGQLNDVVFHEMQHVLGFGTLWTTVSPMLIVNTGTPQTAFTGATGIRDCLGAGGATTDCLPAIPLENSGGPGTADGHWRWSIFGDELMTAFLPPPGTPKLLSAMTIGSLSDLGYLTNPNAADAYTIPSATVPSMRTLWNARGVDRSGGREVLLKPRLQVTRDGVRSAVP